MHIITRQHKFKIEFICCNKLFRIGYQNDTFCMHGRKFPLFCRMTQLGFFMPGHAARKWSVDPQLKQRRVEPTWLLALPAPTALTEVLGGSGLTNIPLGFEYVWPTAKASGLSPVPCAAAYLSTASVRASKSNQLESLEDSIDNTYSKQPSGNTLFTRSQIKSSRNFLKLSTRRLQIII